jgi:hypothetical protein
MKLSITPEKGAILIDLGNRLNRKANRQGKKSGGKANKSQTEKLGDAITCHGTTHDGINVQSMRGQLRKGRKNGTLLARITGADGRYIGTFDRQQLAELEVAAKTMRAALDQVGSN